MHSFRELTPSDGQSLRAEHYRLLPFDLRNSERLDEVFARFEVDFAAPTLFLAECVFTYVQTKHTNALLSFISAHFAFTFVFNYEMMNALDPFG